MHGERIKTMWLFVFSSSTSRFNPRGESPVPTGYDARVLPNASLDVFEKRQISSYARNERRFLGCRAGSLVTVLAERSLILIKYCYGDKIKKFLRCRLGT